jgi:hypothetical protein
LANANSNRSADTEKWRDLDEWPGQPQLEPGDLAPPVQRLEYHPSAKLHPDFERLINAAVTIAPGPIEVVPLGAPDPPADRLKRREQAVLTAVRRGEIELGSRSLRRPIEAIRLVPGDIENARLDLRSRQLTLRPAPRQHPTIHFGVVWRPIRETTLTELVLFLNTRGRQKEAAVLAEAKQQFPDKFTQKMWRQARRLILDANKLRPGHKK